MKERIKAQEDATIEVSFELYLATNLEKTWELLTTTNGLEKWFKELQVGELGVTGYLEFLMTPQEIIKLPILSYQPKEIFGFEWGQNQVLIHLEADKVKGTKITFIEIITKVDQHTGRDSAGWYMCLEKLRAVSENKPYSFDEIKFERLAQRYQKESEFLYET